MDSAVVPLPSAISPLLEVRDLKKYFPIRKGVFSRTVGHVKAVDGVSFDVNAGEILRFELEGLGASLPSYKRVLGYEIWFEPLPRTTTGKLLLIPGKT